MSLTLPQKVPALGFYYHYKHNPHGTIKNYAYEVIGVGFHTEENARPGEEYFLIYRPLYNAAVLKAAKELGIPCFDTRPLSMWMEDVVVDGKKLPRFRKINDPTVIKILEDVRKSMYP